MKKQLTEKIVYEPNDRLKVTVNNKPVYEDGAVVGYDRKMTVAFNAGYKNEKLAFATDSDIEDFVKGLDFEDPQQSMFEDEADV